MDLPRKACRNCGLEKPEEAFSPSRRVCRACVNDQQRRQTDARRAQPDAIKTCVSCGQDKRQADYYALNARCKTCWLAARASSHAANPEARRKIARDYYDRHGEKCRSAGQVYRARPEIQERRQEQARLYRQQHREERSEYYRAWCKDHPSAARELYRRAAYLRKARTAKVRTEDFDRAEIFLRDNGQCRYCRCTLDPANWHLDHFVPISRGGDHVRDNVVASCPPCNLRKNTKLPEEFVRLTTLPLLD